jgi:hypothetical protein
MSKIEAFWQDATADDVARVMAGEIVEARFRDDEGGKWLESDHSLGGYDSTEEFCKWISSTGCPWRYCQVYREPSWYTNKPDPGPEHRLLCKFPDEELKPGDECFSSTGKWDQSYKATIGERQSFGMWYRRRIEPVEPKFAVGQMVKVVGPKATDAKHWDDETARHVGTLQTVKYIEKFANPTEIFYGVYGIDSRKFCEDYLEAVEPEPVEAPNTYHYTNPGDVVHCPNGTVIVIGSKGFEVTQ